MTTVTKIKQNRIRQVPIHPEVYFFKNEEGLMIVNLYIIPHRDYEGSYCNCYYIPKLYPA